MDDAQTLFATACAMLRQRDGRAGALLPQLERHPDFAPGWADLAITLAGAGQPAAALVAAERALAAAPALARAWFALGLAKQDLRDLDGAADAYRHALAARPNLHEAALNLGITLQEARHFDAALDAYATAYRLHPESFGRIAQAVVSAPVGRLWLDLGHLRAVLAARA